MTRDIAGNGYEGPNYVHRERQFFLLTINSTTMAGLGKKILSAFVEVTDKKAAVADKPAGATSNSSTSAGASGPGVNAGPEPALIRQIADSRSPAGDAGPHTGDRFSEYFDKLFAEANIPGPDYYEFSKMISAMQAIPDEQSRFYAAYAGLQVQGLDKTKLLSTADEYLRVIDSDAGHFKETIDGALKEKVQSKQAEAEAKSQRIQSLSREITELQSQIAALYTELKENEAKIMSSKEGYDAEYGRRKAKIQDEIEKIRHYIQ